MSFILVLKRFGSVEKNLFIQSLPIILILKIVIFYFSELYKRTWGHSSFEDIVRVIKAVFISSLAEVFILAIIFRLGLFGGIVFFMLDFYLLLTFVAGFRMSYRVLFSFYNPESTKRGKKVLIYGAGHKGSVLLEEIKHNKALNRERPDL